MARILMVGTATLDLVFELDHAPAADEEMRARALRTCRGGNAANTAVVLSRLGHAVDFLGVLADAAESAVIERDFDAHGVGYGCCPRLPGLPPTSSIYLSGANRSIVHYRDLPELSVEHFQWIVPTEYDLIHFECRNVPVIAKVMRHFREQAPDVMLSLEVEKPRPGMEGLYEVPDILISSRGFAEHHGYGEPDVFLRWMRSLAPQAMLALGWGDQGAFGMAVDNKVMHAPAARLTNVVDTLGAGDTFNAGLLDALAATQSLPSALAAACVLAGRKCAMQGFEL